MVVHNINPSTWEGEAGEFLISRLAWFTESDPGQPGPHRETLSQKTKKKKSYTRPLSRDSESKKNLERGYTDPVPKRTQLPAQATIHNKTLNYHRWKNQSIP
jgi:hypothetical protein